jgi:hypothetical protein
MDKKERLCNPALGAACVDVYLCFGYVDIQGALQSVAQLK